jgi:histidine triad (HIT) family protein
MSSVFSKIIAGALPSYKLFETKTCFAVLDAFPLQRGHSLIFPKIQQDLWHELPQDVYADLTQQAYYLAKAIARVIPCNRVSQHIIGLEVPHAHIHLIPINSTQDCNFNALKPQFTKEEFEAVAALIRSALPPLHP